MFLLFFAEGLHDLGINLVAQLDIGVIGVVTLHLGLRQKIVCNKILEPTVFRSGASEELQKAP